MFPLFVVHEGGALIIESVTIENFQSSAIVAEQGSSILLDGVKFAGNAALGRSTRRRQLMSDDVPSDCGGAIRLNGGARANISKSLLSQNTAARGGAICALNGSSVVIDRCTSIESNTATERGGGIFAAGASIIEVRRGDEGSTFFFKRLT